jgi:putative hemolysin
MTSLASPTDGAARGTTPDLDLELGRYRLRFARTDGDKDRIFALRFEVFNLELGEGLEESFATRRDSDAFDAQCDHLMVIDTATDWVVGTYRLQTCAAAEAGNGFYSGTEFDLAALPRAVLTDSIELGRACIAKEHRSSRALFLLWTGLASYVLWNGKRYFFGCCSLTSQDPAEGARALAWLERAGKLHPELRVLPMPGYECAHEGPVDVPDDYALPKLFGTYMRYGARVCGPPAIDRFFGTIDFLALLDSKSLAPGTFEQFAPAGSRPR